MQVNDIVIWSNYPNAHTWVIRGIHLGADGVESLVELENLSHKPGWTGEWMTHQMMFVPECLLRQCKIGRAVDLGV
jgi:hypothetical protein